MARNEVLPHLREIRAIRGFGQWARNKVLPHRAKSAVGPVRSLLDQRLARRSRLNTKRLRPRVHESRAVLLSGEHPTLPAAELRALLDVHDPDATVVLHGLVALVLPGRRQLCDVALGRMALGHEWGILWDDAPDSPAGIEQLALSARKRADGQGSAAVVTERRGPAKSHGSSAVDRAGVERTLGAALKAAGHTIDLEHPQRILSVWFLDGRLWMVERRGLMDRSQHEERVSDERAHFSPVSLHPRRAASLLHLARVHPGGRVLDPFCGTGAFVLEAALEEYDAWGSDIDSFMVQGTLQTLADSGPRALAGVVFKADIAAVPNLVEGVHGIVTDLPYGRASSSDGEDLGKLYDRAGVAFAHILPKGRYAVIGHSDPRLLAAIDSFGFKVTERHEERVHRSLTRHYVVVMRV